MIKYGFKVVDSINEYELLTLSFDGENPYFAENARKEAIRSETLTIFHGMQCPYISNCIEQVKTYCENNNIPLDLIQIDSVEKAKSVPCTFNNWAVFYKGNFETVHMLNEGYLKKLLEL